MQSTRMIVLSLSCEYVNGDKNLKPVWSFKVIFQSLIGVRYGGWAGDSSSSKHIVQAKLLNLD